MDKKRGGFGVAAAAATLMIFLLSPSFSNPLLDDLVSEHIRSLMPSHLTDVVSTDQHTATAITWPFGKRGI